jgi:hypothetical protein
MRRASVLAALIVSVFAVQSASAAVIGVRGGDSGSEPMTDPSFFPLLQDDCTSAPQPEQDPLAGYYCVTYETGFVGQDGFVFALDLQFKDENGNLIPVEMFFGGLFENGIAPESDFTLRLDIDEHTIRLCSDQSLAGQAACGQVIIESTDVVQILNVITQTHFRVFTDLQDENELQNFVSIQAINTVPNVPEPATLLLMGLGVAAAAGRRFRSRRQ